MRAGEIRDAEVNRHEPWRAHGSLPILRGAPTHSCAFLLQALAEDGWELRKVENNE